MAYQRLSLLSLKPYLFYVLSGLWKKTQLLPRTFLQGVGNCSLTLFNLYLIQVFFKGFKGPKSSILRSSA